MGGRKPPTTSRNLSLPVWKVLISLPGEVTSFGKRVAVDQVGLEIQLGSDWEIVHHPRRYSKYLKPLSCDEVQISRLISTARFLGISFVDMFVR